MTSEVDKSTAVYIERGLTNLRSQNYLEALDNYTHAIELDPTNAHLYIKRGDIYTTLERYEEALADYNYAIQLDPSLMLFKPDIQFRNRPQKQSDVFPKIKLEFEKAGIAPNLQGEDLVVGNMMESILVDRSQLIRTTSSQEYFHQPNLKLAFRQ